MNSLHDACCTRHQSIVKTSRFHCFGQCIALKDVFLSTGTDGAIEATHTVCLSRHPRS